MPELPEVESVRRDLRSIQGCTFDEVRTPDRVTRRNLRAALNQTVLSVGRRGKYLLLSFEKQQLVIHLGMSGRLLLAAEQFVHPHLRWSLGVSNGAHLVFVDRRRFGRFRVVPLGEHAFPGMSDLGPEPLDRSFGAGRLHRAANASARSVKTVLLDQRVVAGLGNIYVDEALHAARIHPTRVGLDPEHARVLATEIKRIIRAAVELRGASFSLHNDRLIPPGTFTDQLRVFGRAGQRCQCGELVIKIKHRGRGTHLCPRCQPVQ